MENMTPPSCGEHGPLHVENGDVDPPPPLETMEHTYASQPAVSNHKSATPQRDVVHQ